MLRRTLVSLSLAAPAAALAGCLVLPVRSAPGVEGRVIDAASRQPLAGAIVVVRFDGRHGDLLPDREHLGHAEVRTDAQGRFRIDRYFEPGFALWPFFEGEARVVSVLAEGHRCPRPRRASGDAPVEIALSPALDAADQRESCRPVAARAGEAAVYMAAWRGLFEQEGPDREQEEQRRLEQILAARAALGFGENCEGPVVDLALSPDGATAAYAASEEQATAVHVVDVSGDAPARPLRAGVFPRTPPRRLAWSSSTKLVLWEPVPEPVRGAASARLGEGAVEVIWRAPRPRAKAPAPPRTMKPRTPAPPAAPPAMPLEPEDIYDEGASRWEGRGFTLVRSLDAATGLARDRLRTVAADGTRHEIELPGEPCGPTGHFGRPQYRIAADGRHAVDLRYVRGACRAVWIDLDSGAWSPFDGSARARAICRTERRIPPSHLGVALRGYLRQVEEALRGAGLDPTRTYVMRIDPSGKTNAETRDASGNRQVVPVAPFPVATPLQILHVSNVAPLQGVAPRRPAPRVKASGVQPPQERPAPPDPNLEPL
jgi:hypothetical protein